MNPIINITESFSVNEDDPDVDTRSFHIGLLDDGPLFVPTKSRTDDKDTQSAFEYPMSESVYYQSQVGDVPTFMRVPSSTNIVDINLIGIYDGSNTLVAGIAFPSFGDKILSDVTISSLNDIFSVRCAFVLELEYDDTSTESFTIKGFDTSTSSYDILFSFTDYIRSSSFENEGVSASVLQQPAYDSISEFPETPVVRNADDNPLFKFIQTKEYENGKYKIIVTPESEDGCISIQIRSYREDTVIFERDNVSITDRSSDNYITKVIGDKWTRYDQDSESLITTGDFEGLVNGIVVVDYHENAIENAEIQGFDEFGFPYEDAPSFDYITGSTVLKYQNTIKNRGPVNDDSIQDFRGVDVTSSNNIPYLEVGSTSSDSIIESDNSSFILTFYGGYDNTYSFNKKVISRRSFNTATQLLSLQESQYSPFYEHLFTPDLSVESHSDIIEDISTFVREDTNRMFYIVSYGNTSTIEPMVLSTISNNNQFAVYYGKSESMSRDEIAIILPALYSSLDIRNEGPYDPPTIETARETNGLRAMQYMGAIARLTDNVEQDITDEYGINVVNDLFGGIRVNTQDVYDNSGIPIINMRRGLNRIENIAFEWVIENVLFEQTNTEIEQNLSTVLSNEVPNRFGQILDIRVIGNEIEHVEIEIDIQIQEDYIETIHVNA